MKNLTMPLHARQNAGWKVYDDRGLEFANCHNFDMSAAERESNAAFIVKAVNSHEELLAILELLDKEVYLQDKTTNGTYKRFKAALAKTRGEV